MEADDVEDLNFKVNEALELINNWMGNSELSLAEENIKVLSLKGPRIRECLIFGLNGPKVVQILTVQTI